MSKPITNSYRAQILESCVKVLHQAGSSIVKPAQRDEMVRVLEDMIDRLNKDDAAARRSSH